MSLNPYRGEGYVELGGQKLYYSFGINATRLWCELTGLTRNELIQLFTPNAQGESTLDDGHLSDLIYCGLAAGSRLKNGTNINRPGFSREDVADWIERADDADVADVVSSIHKSLMTPKQLEVYEQAVKALEQKDEAKKKTSETTSSEPSTQESSDTD